MSVQYTGGVQCTGGCSVHWGVIMSTLGDTMSTLGAYHDECGGYHEVV